MNLFTIGFTRKSARAFFEKLQGANVRCVVDIRLNNVSQLSGFAKKDDLRYFLETIAGIRYLHCPSLAPTQELLSAFRANRSDWQGYSTAFDALMKTRAVELTTPADLLDRGCLLCSEASPKYCHRRLVAEYLQRHQPEMTITHLM